MPVTDPAHAVTPSQRIRVDGRLTAPPGAPVVVALHKPPGYLSTAADPAGRPTVLDLAPRAFGRLFPVGRLDGASEGLLLLTNDGDLCYGLTHPRHAVPRVYRARVAPAPDPAQVARLRAGVALHDGPTRPAQVRAEPDGDGAWLQITLQEGRNRQVRRMCAAVGLRVLRLVRIAVGPLPLGDLAPGAWRRLRAEEVEALRAAAAGGADPARDRKPLRCGESPARKRGERA